MRDMNPSGLLQCRVLGCVQGRFSLATFVFLCLFFTGSLSGNAQNTSPTGMPPGSPMGGAPNTHLGTNSAGAPEDPTAAREARKMEAAQMSDRFKHIQADTRTLLELATELQIAVDKSDRNELSLDVIKKAEQIEKLAKSVKEKMRQQ